MISVFRSVYSSRAIVLCIVSFVDLFVHSFICLCCHFYYFIFMSGYVPNKSLYIIFIISCEFSVFVHNIRPTAWFHAVDVPKFCSTC